MFDFSPFQGIIFKRGSKMGFEWQNTSTLQRSEVRYLMQVPCLLVTSADPESAFRAKYVNIHFHIILKLKQSQI